MALRQNKKLNYETSMHDSPKSDKDGKLVTLEDRLADDLEEVGDIVALRMEVKRLYSAINEVLTTREKMILQKRFGLCATDAITQREIGDELEISRSYVSRLEKKILQKLKENLCNKQR